MGSWEPSAPPGAMRMLEAGTGFSTPRSATWVSDGDLAPTRQVRHDRGGRQRLAGGGQVAQARRDVHAVADVVVALHEDDVART